MKKSSERGIIMNSLSDWDSKHVQAGSSSAADGQCLCEELARLARD